MTKVGKYYDVNHTDGIEVEITFGRDQRIIINNDVLAINNTFYDLIERYVDEEGTTVLVFENGAKLHIKDYRNQTINTGQKVYIIGAVLTLLAVGFILWKY